MLVFTLKKMLRNNWMVSCLIMGAIVFVAVFSMIPTYSNGVYSNMLLRDLEAQQTKSGIFPGNWLLNILVKESESNVGNGFERAAEIERLVEEYYVPDIRLPVLASRKHYSLDRFYYLTKAVNNPQQIALLGVSNFFDHVDIVSGRRPNSDATKDIMEFVMPLDYYQRSDIRLDQEFDLYTYALPRDERLFGTAVCVGVYEPKFDDPFWYSDIAFQPQVFVIDYDYLVSRFVETESIFVSTVSFFTCFDYSQLRSEDTNSLLSGVRRTRIDVYGFGNLTFHLTSTLILHNDKREVLEYMLWILIVPVLIMLVFYIYMVSNLMIRYESNEIAVLKSRGAKNMQIFSVYALMSILIAGAAFLLGPPIGLLAARVLGLSNGFMELIIRRALPLELSATAYFYAGAAAVWFVLVMLVPALKATRDTIVESKQKKSRRTSSPLWQKLGLDVVLIIISLYALYVYNTNAELRALADIGAVGAPADPLVLLASSMFVLGAGLIFLRIFPLLIKLIYHSGKNIWPPTLYSTLLSISRFKGSSQFLSLFLIFNLGLGLFNATAARTLNRFIEDRVRYEHGADIVLNQTWPMDITYYRVTLNEDDELTFTRTGNPHLQPSVPPGIEQQPEGMIISRTQVKEPPFDEFLKLDGVRHATKVFKRSVASISSTARNTSASIMGIVPHEFGEVAWFRDDLLPIHINNYLNVMTADPSAVLLSSSMRDNYGFQTGDHIRIGWRDQSGRLDCTVYGFVDFWPSINPETQPNFVIANLNTIHRQMRIEPYSVWLSLEDGLTSRELYESINETDIRVSRMVDTQQRLISTRSDPLLQGLNGTLTLGFIVTLLITFIGFLIYWILSIRSRVLQFGILRAMGLSRTGLIATLLWEQLLVSGSAIIAGFGIGALASRIFVPALQHIYPVSEQVPPFYTTVSRSDYTVLLSAFGSMLLTGLVVLIIMIRRLKPDQALKLGED